MSAMVRLCVNAWCPDVGYGTSVLTPGALMSAMVRLCVNAWCPDVGYGSSLC